VQGTVTLTGVLCVPGLHKNLISVPQLIEKVLSLKMLKNQCIVEAKRGPVMAIPKSGSFYVAECLMVVTDPPAPETVTMINKKVTFAVDTDPLKQQISGIRDLVILRLRQLFLCPRRNSFWEFQSLKRVNTKVLFALAVL